MKKVAVIGSGVMGAGIAAHCVNAGIEVALLDIPAKDTDDRSLISKLAVQRQIKSGGFMSPDLAGNIETGNLEDDIDMLRDCDWIIEAVVENLQIKRDLYHRLNTIRKSDTIVSSNTSTIPLQHLVDGLPEEFKSHFVITHFFNPPRQMRLLELVGGPSTNPDVLVQINQFCDRLLGKSVVYCKDTPGFIANRIGVFWMLTGVHEALATGIDVVEADALISKPAGIPKTGIFGLWDLVGIDLWPKLIDSMVLLLPEMDPYHSVAAMPELINKMIGDGYTGRKGKGGFYRLLKEDKKRIKQGIDLDTGEYADVRPPSSESLAISKNGLKALLDHPGPGGRYVWRVLSKTLNYAASLIPEIADDYQSVDEAMRTGFAWQSGPFELIDQIGASWFAEQLETDGQSVAGCLDNLGEDTFYREKKGVLQVMHPVGEYRNIVRAPGTVLLEDIKRSSSPLRSNAAASLWDTGDGVTCLELHSKMNAMQPESMEMIQQALEITGRDHKAMIIYSEGPAFSAGANLSLFYQWLRDGATDQVVDFINRGQQSYKAIKFSPFPVVAATAGLALGGGCELAMHCDAIQAHAETCAGLVEKNVGLVPAWGGCKEMLLRHKGNIQTAFELIATARTSGSAAEARSMGILRQDDGITMNRQRLLADAKTRALDLCDGYLPPTPEKIKLNTNGALMDWVSRESDKGKFSDHDLFICEALSGVFVNGEVIETDIYEHERDAFVNLAGTAATLARIEHILNTGKPLRN